MPRSDKRRVLLVCYGGGHANIVARLIPEINAGVDLEPIVLGLTTAAHVLGRAGIPFFGFRELLAEGDEPALDIGRRLLGETAANAAVSVDESVAYLGLSYSELERTHGKTEAARQYESRGRQSFLPVQTLERVFDRFQPDIVVATNSPRAEQAAIMVARSRGIPAVCIVDLFGGFDIDRIKLPDYADRICVLSEATKRTFVAAGRNAEDIVVTGNPAFDSLSDPFLVERAAEYKALHGLAGKRVILWASQVEPKDRKLPRRIERELFDIAKRHPELRIVIRPHPSESLPDNWVPAGVHVSDQSEELNMVLSASDVVVVITSTVGLQAALLQKSVLTLDVPITTEPVPYVEMGISKRVADLGSLESAILHATSNGKVNIAGLAEIGGAAARVVGVLRDLLDRQ